MCCNIWIKVTDLAYGYLVICETFIEKTNLLMKPLYFSKLVVQMCYVYFYAPSSVSLVYITDAIESPGFSMQQSPL